MSLPRLSTVNQVSTPQQPTREQARGYLGLVLIGLVIGIPAALVGALFLALVHVCEDWLWTDLPEALGESSPPWYLIVGLPVVGALFVGIARRLLPGDGGHSPVNGLAMAPTPWKYAPGVALAALGTLAFGAVLGPEAPLIALGSAVGMIVPSLISMPDLAKKVVGTAGSFSAVSAVFGGPLVAGMLLLEGGIAAGSALIPALIPGLVAAATGYVLFIGLGDWGGINEAGITVTGLPAYDGTHIFELLLAIVVGVLAALVLTPVHRLAHRIDALSKPSSGRRMLSVLLLGGLAVGVLALLVQGLGADYGDELFSGQSAIPQILTETSVWVLVVILIGKALGYAISLGAGFRGGPVFPGIFIGIVIAMIGVVVFDASPTWAVAVGTAAGMTAATSLIFSSMLFSMLLVGGNGLDALPAAVFASAAAWLTTKALSLRVTPDPTENLAADIT